MPVKKLNPSYWWSSLNAPEISKIIQQGIQPDFEKLTNNSYDYSLKKDTWSSAKQDKALATDMTIAALLELGEIEPTDWPKITGAVHSI